MSKNTHITRLQVSNFKRIVEADVRMDGSVIIGGDNTQGKSSLLDSVEAALLGASKIPGDPVHHGADGATIRLELDNGMVVERTISPDRKHKLKISGGANGMTPQRWLDGHVSATTLDPLAILALPPRDKVVMLRSLAGCDTSDLDAAYDRAFGERTAANKDLEKAKAAADSLAYVEGLPSEELDPDELIAKLRAANAANREIDDGRAQLERLRAERASVMEDIERTKRRLQMLTESAEKITAEGQALQSALNAKHRVDISLLESELANITKTNAAIAENRNYASAKQLVAVMGERAKAVDSLVKDIDAQRKKRLETAKWPLPGLSVENGSVTFNGVPLEQASQAEQLRVAVALAAAAKPDVGVVLVREGCRLDGKSLQMLLAEVAAAGLQAFVERVGDGDAGAIVIEGGRVRG